jgi:toxin ParE1/3/4
MRIEIAKRAQADLGLIFADGLRQFGEAQAAAYSRSLGEAVELIAQFPFAGPALDAPSPHLRSFHCQSHTIIYRPDEGRILIVRILHDRMVPYDHLEL